MITKLVAVLACLAVLAAGCSDDSPEPDACAPERPPLAVGANVSTSDHPTDCDEQAGRSEDPAVMKDIDAARQRVVEERVRTSEECLPGTGSDGYVGGYLLAGQIVSTVDPGAVLDSRAAEEFGIRLARTLPEDGFGNADLALLHVYEIDDADPLRAVRALQAEGIEAAPDYAVFTAPGYMFGPANDPVPAILDGLPAVSTSGEVTVAVVDTGFDAGGPGQPLGPLAGHGLFAQGVVAAAAPGAGIVPVEVGAASDLVYGESSVFAAMMTDLAGTPPDLVNMSLGAYSCPDLPPVGLTAAIDNLLALNPDLLVVAAAGNDGWDNPFWPAALGSDPAYAGRVVGVASAAEGVLSPWSNFGPSAQACANGEDVVSTYPTGTFSYVDGSTGSFEGAAIWSGTSFAAPAVSGAVAAGFTGSAQATWLALQGEFSCP